MSDAGGAVRGGVEAGGTKFVCAVGSGPDDLRGLEVIPTTTPAQTLGRVIEFFSEQRRRGLGIVALGIASFGPLDLVPGSSGYGRITTTAKPGWSGTDLIGPMRRQLGVPVVLDTDVNGAAYGEFRWGAGRDLNASVYLTVGTGIGGGTVIGGRPMRGLLHPEMGHLHVRRHPDDDYPGCCPFHTDCLEGLASGPAIQARTGRAPGDLGGGGGARIVEHEAWYLAQLVSAVIYVLSPERIVLGGGVMQLPGLMQAVRGRTIELLGGALDGTAVAECIEDYVVAPALGTSSGVLGALGLAELALVGATPSSRSPVPAKGPQPGPTEDPRSLTARA